MKTLLNIGRLHVFGSYHCRRNGGLALGLRLAFPVLFIMSDNSHKMITTFTISFLVAGLIFEWRSPWKPPPGPDYRPPCGCDNTVCCDKCSK